MHVVGPNCSLSAAATQQKRHKNAIVQLFLLWFNEQNHKILGYQSLLILILTYMGHFF